MSEGPGTTKFELVEVDYDLPIATVRFNRPDSLNALNPQMIAEISAVLDELEQDVDVRAIVMTGSGRAFCSGYDLSAGTVDRSNWTVNEYKLEMEPGWQFPIRVWRFKKPIVAAVHGYALGGGCELAMLADLTVASRRAVFGEPEIRFASSSTLIMPWHVPMKIARQLLYTGSHIDAQRAYEVGMVNEVVENDELLPRARYHARLLAKIAPEALRVMKEGINHTYEVMGLFSALRYHDNLVAILAATKTRESQAFDQIAEAFGVKAALNWQKEQFQEVEELA